MTERTVETIRSEVERAPIASEVYLLNRPFPPAGPRVLFSGSASVFLIFFDDDHARSIRFVEREKSVRDAVPAGTRLASLLVSPDDVPPGVAVLDNGRRATP